MEDGFRTVRQLAIRHVSADEWLVHSDRSITLSKRGEISHD
jgi:hypothetical protein